MRDLLRTLRWSAWLGWQIESNWTDPWLFALYLVVKPVTSSLLLVAMYWAAWGASGGHVRSGFLPFLYVGNACFMLVGSMAFDMSYVIITDREHYGMLEYLRLSPIGFRSYLLGRGLARGVTAVLGVFFTLGAGVLLLPELRSALGANGIAWPWLLLDLVLGAVLLLALGLIMAGAALNLPRHGMFLGEGLTGVVYLLSGALFPISYLPAWLQPISFALPTTYWLEGVRRALLGPGELPSPLAHWEPIHLTAALAVSTLVLLIVSQVFFGWAERRATRLGKFDETSGF